LTFGTVGDAVLDRRVVVELDEEVAGDAESEEVDGRSADDLVGSQMDREERVDQCEQAAGRSGDQEPDHPASALVRAVEAPEGTHQHHPLEADVHDAAALGEDPADRGEDEGCRKAERLCDQRRVEDRIEVAHGRPGGENAEPDPEETGRHGAPAEPPATAGHGPDAQNCGDQADEDRPVDRPRLERRDREEGRKCSDEDACVAARSRTPQPRADRILEPGCPGGHAGNSAVDAAAFARRRSNLRGVFQT
jgi:hypothetical protein